MMKKTILTAAASGFAVAAIAVGGLQGASASDTSPTETPAFEDDGLATEFDVDGGDLAPEEVGLGDSTSYVGPHSMQ